MRYVVNQAKGGVLKLDEETKQQLHDKHPSAEDAAPETLIEDDVPENLDPIVFSALDGDVIKKCALKTEGVAGVSQADDWSQASKKLLRIFVQRWLQELADLRPNMLTHEALKLL